MLLMWRHIRIINHVKWKIAEIKECLYCIVEKYFWYHYLPPIWVECIHFLFIYFFFAWGHNHLVVFFNNAYPVRICLVIVIHAKKKSWNFESHCAVLSVISSRLILIMIWNSNRKSCRWKGFEATGEFKFKELRQSGSKVVFPCIAQLFLSMLKCKPRLFLSNLNSA